MKAKAVLILFLLMMTNTIFFTDSASSQGDASSPSLQRMEQGWEYQWVESVEADTGIPQTGWLPTENVKELDEPREDREILYLRNTFPDGGWIDPAIFISFMYGTFEVYQGDQLIYQFGNIPEADTVTYRGYNRRHFIELDPTVASDQITIRSYSNGNLIGVSGAVSAGSHSSYLTKMIRDDFDKIVIGAIQIFITVLALIFFIIKRFSVLYLAYAAMTFCAALYSFSITGSKQFIIDVPYVWIYVFQIAVFFRSAFDLMIIDKLFGPGYKKWVRRLWQIHLGLAVIAFTLSVTNPDYFTVTKGIFEKLSGFEVLLILAIVIRVFLRNTDAKIYAVGFLFMAGFMIRDLLVFTGVIYLKEFYLLGHIGQFALVLAIGIILVRQHRGAGDRLKIR
ncbi:7TM diverse intracellular signaling domain-containing protein [Alkalihalobacterium chitinilyticum]|uniref:7TM-DISM domain-containing protein n=1 Tax=Alkalihalobacterium chitinilyticum TaxID=2980103 RepID=A0ABT5VIG7_9BACI|nr:7TM diverse intracellular signaling domain-containing protein [Alkalihalobacterium chitinilyticum]MDE5415050.1 7TM-DISM domain-containing protein [Alkalihalobacterium chitinilyticum]